MAYTNEGVPSTDETSASSSSQSRILHSYSNVPFATSASSPLSTVGQYQHYYSHSIPSQQQVFNIPQTTGFYPPTIHAHGHHPEFSTSSPSVASSSSSIESSRKTNNRKRNPPNTEKISATTKSNNKRKLTDDDNDDDEENKCYLRGAPVSNLILEGNHSQLGTGDEDKEKQARENHCEIERRRRVKMATYFAELCDMVPSCANLARKPDKLTILRMAAQFMKTLRTTNNSLTMNSPNLSSQSDHHKPSFLNDQELKYLMVESCDAFLFALNCDNLRLIYVSDAIEQILSYSCQDWYSRYFYDFVHPDDVEKVREQLNLQSPDSSPNGTCSARVLDLKSGTVKKDGHATSTRLNSKRSFICRIRVGSSNILESNHQNLFINPSILRRRHRTSLGPSIDGHLYEVVHINGYIRNLNNHSSHHDNPNPHQHHPTSSNSNGQMAFIALARIQNSSSPNVNDLTNGSNSSINSSTTEFTCRCHPETSEILFVDQRCAPIIGYKSQELLHKNLFEQIHPDDQMKFQDLFKRTVTQKNLPNTSSNLSHLSLRFRSNIDNEYIPLKGSTYAFCNPCTDEIEFIIVTFLSTTNKTSVIANTNDYHRQNYEAYSRLTTNLGSHYSTNPEEQTYQGNNPNSDGRTFSTNNTGSTWAASNENWISTNYLDSQTSLSLYHQYH